MLHEHRKTCKRQTPAEEPRAGAPVARSVPQLSTLPNFISLVPPCGLFFPLQAATEGDALAKQNSFIALRCKRRRHVSSHRRKKRGVRRGVSHDILKCNFQQSESNLTLTWPCCSILRRPGQHCCSLDFFFPRLPFEKSFKLSPQRPRCVCSC